MIDPEQLLVRVIRPTLKCLNLYSVEAERLVLGTACQESECGRWLVQIGGPAVGICQMEPATHDDIITNWVNYHPELKIKLQYISPRLESRELITNLAYSVAMCRVHYRRDPEPIPTSLPLQAEYWKRVYNTVKGAGTAEQYIHNWYRFVQHGNWVL